MIWGWSSGWNKYGQLALDDYNNRNIFTKINSDTSFTTISCGYANTAAIDIDGNLWNTGSNNFSQPNINQDKFPHFRKIVTEDSTTFVAVSSSHYYTTAIDMNGNIWSSKGIADDNVYIKFQNKYNITKHFIKNVVFTAVSSGYDHIIALDSDGNLWGNGWNEYGQLGLHDNDPRNSFIKILIDSLFISVSCGEYHTLALDLDGNLWSTGNNEN